MKEISIYNKEAEQSALQFFKENPKSTIDEIIDETMEYIDDLMLEDYNAAESNLREFLETNIFNKLKTGKNENRN